MKNLGSLGGTGNTQPWPGSEGLGINNASQVVGLNPTFVSPAAK
jgi:hypothetical protein